MLSRLVATSEGRGGGMRSTHRRKPVSTRTALAAAVLTLVIGGISCTTVESRKSCDTPGEMSTPPDCYPEPPAPPAPGKSWRVVYSVDFDGEDLDPDKLTPCFDWNYGECTSTFNTGRETYRPEQVRVSDGIARLVAEPLAPAEQNDSCYEGLCTYKSGLISTARPNAETGQYLFPFTYGYLEARLKFPAQPGFFTALWMLPTNPDYKYGKEIDILEVLGGDPRTLYMTYYYGEREQRYRVNAGIDDNGACPVRDFSRDWIRVGVDWQPDHIAWYVNGVKCGEFTDAAHIESGPMQFIMNLMVDNEWERDEGSVLTDLTAAAELQVDYIRILQQS